MRSAFMLILLTTAVWGCARDRTEECNLAYDHVVEITTGKQNPEMRTKFVAACVDAWDQERYQCLMRAVTGKEALACKPGKTRPG